MNKLVEALGKIRTITHYKAQTNNTIHLTIPTVHELAEQALSEHAANKEDKWKELEDWVEDNFSKTNDYGTTLNATGERIIDKIKSIKN